MKNGTRKKSEKHIIIFTFFKNEAWKSLSHAEKDKHTLSGCKACQESILKLLILFLYDYRHRAARAALESPIHSQNDYIQAQSSPCCTRLPPLTPCTTTGTEKPVLHSTPPVTPCMTIYRHRAARAALDSPPSLPVRLQAQRSPCYTRLPLPPSLPVRLQAQSSPCCTRLPPSLPV